MSENKSIIPYPSDAEEESYIQIERTEEFLEAAKKLSEYISSLPLSYAQNDTLVHLTVEQVQAAERNAFRFGLDMGVKIGKEFCTHTE